MNILTNQIALSVIFSFLISQFLKFIILVAKNEKHAIQALYRQYGGMPSTHTAIVSAIVFSVYLIEGFSNLFFVALFFSLIIISDLIHMREIRGEFNHTILEVIAGATIAFCVSLLVSLIA